MKFMRPKDLAGEILDMGNGSGVFPFLLRKMGANHITATDVCPHAIQSALKNERLEFENHQISFRTSDLFMDIGSEKKLFDSIKFNPPGWRSPSPAFLQRLHEFPQGIGTPAASMFFGDRIALDFFDAVPAYLNAVGELSSG